MRDTLAIRLLIISIFLLAAFRHVKSRSVAFKSPLSEGKRDTITRNKFPVIIQVFFQKCIQITTTRMCFPSTMSRRICSRILRPKCPRVKLNVRGISLKRFVSRSTPKITTNASIGFASEFSLLSI